MSVFEQLVMQNSLPNAAPYISPYGNGATLSGGGSRRVRFTGSAVLKTYGNTAINTYEQRFVNELRGDGWGIQNLTFQRTDYVSSLYGEVHFNIFVTADIPNGYTNEQHAENIVRRMNAYQLCDPFGYNCGKVFFEVSISYDSKQPEEPSAAPQKTSNTKTGTKTPEVKTVGTPDPNEKPDPDKKDSVTKWFESLGTTLGFSATGAVIGGVGVAALVALIALRR